MNEWQNYIFNIMKVMQKHGWNEADVIYLGRERMGGEKASLEIVYNFEVYMWIYRRGKE